MHVILDTTYHGLRGFENGTLCESPVRIVSYRTAIIDHRQTPKSCAKEVHDALNQKAATCRYMQMTKRSNGIPNMCTNLLQHESDCTADFFIHRQTDWSQLQQTYIHTAKHLWPTSYAHYYNNNTRPSGVYTHIMTCKSLGNTPCRVKNIEFTCNVILEDGY